ncbi:hypothetical protein CKS_4252 [Pantoea stewartii subsp. stewartii DC283]|uniref:Uncharacterized protein n=2 Tax=Pantoea stewartii TaxID=66269 RepID=H3RBZ2_PANSE|nr:hypothetical protein CKS_4252 [Pantoea stewartii subsp. stewartii DC283]
MTAMTVTLMYPIHFPASPVRKKDLHTATLLHRLLQAKRQKKSAAEVIPMAYYGMMTPW